MTSSILREELKSNMIEYGYGVNCDRSNPDARSGLKPVARRILFDMYRNGLNNNKPHVKSAKIVGSVMGSLHPHSDSSIYEALVRLSKPWIMRYPLIDFHGNQGNISGDGPASMRYTESRLSKIAEDGLLKNLKKDNVEFMLNYDDSDKEPVTLPAIFPNLLCNPNTGIGYAMASNWLPHNLGETAQAIFDYMDGKELQPLYADFPTGGLIINKNDYANILKTGRGSVKVRGQYRIEKNNIVFYEIPYGVSTESLITEIGKVCEDGTIEGASEIRDESNKKGLRIVIECEKSANVENIIKKLFAKTDLQTSISYNQVAIVDKTPVELNLEGCIKIYLEHNTDCIVKETQYDIKKAEERKEIVEGLLKALADIDDIITLIKGSESSEKAKDNLIKKYNFTENQAKAILAMRLSSLAKLEGVELEQELKGLLDNLQEWNRLVNNKDLQLRAVRERLQAIVKKYGDSRRTEVIQIEVPKEDKEIEEVIPEDVVVILSQTGNVKRIPKASFKTQKRNGKGVKNQDEALLTSISTNTIDNLLLFTTKGKMYKLLVDNIPTGTNASKGVNVNSLINLESDEKIIAATSLQHKINAKYVIFFTKKGLVKKTSLDEYMKVKRSTGIAAVKIKEGDSLANVTFIDDEDIIVVTKGGMSIRFESKGITPIGRDTSGVKSIKLGENDEVIAGLPITDINSYLAVFTEDGIAKKSNLDEFPTQARAGKGVIIHKNGGLISAALVSDEDNILLIGQPNSICIKATDIPLLSRINTGNMMIKGRVVSAVKL